MRHLTILKRCEKVLTTSHFFTGYKISDSLGLDVFFVEFSTTLYFASSVYESEICDILFFKKMLGACTFVIDCRTNSIIYTIKK